MEYSKEYTRKFDSDFFANLNDPKMQRTFELEITVYASEGDYGQEFKIYCKDTGQEFKLEDFPISEQFKMIKIAEDLAYDKAEEVLQDGREFAADALYDSWKEGN